jgi:hypothetical protein
LGNNPDGDDYQMNAGVSGCGGFKKDQIKTVFSAFITADGMNYIFLLLLRLIVIQELIINFMHVSVL